MTNLHSELNEIILIEKAIAVPLILLTYTVA